jgi:hypothetical protein
MADSVQKGNREICQTNYLKNSGGNERRKKGCICKIVANYLPVKLAIPPIIKSVLRCSCYSGYALCSQ